MVQWLSNNIAHDSVTAVQEVMKMIFLGCMCNSVRMCTLYLGCNSVLYELCTVWSSVIVNSALSRMIHAVMPCAKLSQELCVVLL